MSTSFEEVDAAIDRLIKTAMTIKEERDALYAALKTAVNMHDGCFETDYEALEKAEWYGKANAALAKAEGRQ